MTLTNNESNVPVITIDGTSASGKGTVCLALAKKLFWNVLDSGAIYRTLALLALRYNININDEKKLMSLVMHLNICFKINEGRLIVFLSNIDITKDINNERIGDTASKIAIHSAIRNVLLFYQRKFLIHPGLIADGRDMGTIVFPNAFAKIFIDATLIKRANRRLQQLQKNGFNVNLKQVLYKINKRDNRDRKRLIAPLILAKNALLIDSTNLSINQMVTIILKHIKNIL